MRNMLRFASVTALVAVSVAAPSAYAQVTQPSVPAQEATDIAPAHLAAAQEVVGKIFPVGTYRRMMGESMSGMLDGLMGRAMTLPVADIARMAGLPKDQVASMDQSSLEEAMAIIDPHFRERARGDMDAIIGAMGELMNAYEPNVRDALTRAYARRFSQAQLGEISAFFKTPTGNAYAAESMMIFMDQEVVSEMQALMPDMITRMPNIVAQAEKATASIPPARKASDLSKAERQKLAKILGVKEADVKDRAAAHDEEDITDVAQPATEEGTER